MTTLASTVVSALVSSTVMGLLVGFLLVRRTETIKREVEAQFQRFQETLRSGAAIHLIAFSRRFFG